MNATRVSPSEMIHTNVEGLFQQLLTMFATGTGKRYWSTTSGRDETSCHNSTSASKLASCLSFSRDVFKTRGNQSSFTNANEKPNICKCPKHSQNNMEYCHKLDAQPMGGLSTRLGTSSHDVACPNSNSLPEHNQRQLEDERQPHRKNQTLKHNSPMRPSSRLSARSELVYGKPKWPIYYSHRKN